MKLAAGALAGLSACMSTMLFLAAIASILSLGPACLLELLLLPLSAMSKLERPSMTRDDDGLDERAGCYEVVAASAGKGKGDAAGHSMLRREPGVAPALAPGPSAAGEAEVQSAGSSSSKQQPIDADVAEANVSSCMREERKTRADVKPLPASTSQENRAAAKKRKDTAEDGPSVGGSTALAFARLY
ncbi:hypothetical protein U1Q18_051450 [Sarracenia purpurea var. burkii]